MKRAASFFDRVEVFGLVVLLASLPLSEALKSAGIALAVLGYLGKSASGVRPSVGARAPAWALLAFVGAAALSVVAARPELRQPGELFTLGMTVAPFFLVADACSRPGRRRVLAFAIVAGCAFAAIDGYVTYMTGDAHRLALGSVENPVPAAEYLGATLALATALLIAEVGAPLAGPLTGFACGATAIALILTRSRGPLFGAAAGVVMVLGAGLRRRAYALLLLLAVVISATWFALANPESRMSGGAALDSSSASFRLVTWRAATELIAERPMLGHGLGTFAEMGVIYQDEASRAAVENAHNTWMHAGSETGILGAGALTAFLVLGMLAIARSLRCEDRMGRAVSVGALGAVASLAIAGLFSVTTDAEPGMLLFALMALGQLAPAAGLPRAVGGA
ncbi:MAG: O-antigen ligase family protein [Candidatus Eisenbacteria bacterium]|nr:O-antigen ligase family protein [Candidatus Eisenbacteria bacterium]